MTKIDVLLIAPTKNDLPFTPYANLWLSESGKDLEGRTLLSPNLMTEKEINESIDFLITQLEAARKKAKKLLKK